jgi:tRNA guanosine-2'-O-methyltransferase
LYDSIKTAIGAAASNGNAQKSFKNLLNDFRFSSTLDFSNLLSLDNLFHHIPRITGMSDEEIVDFEMIKTTCRIVGCDFAIEEDTSLLDAEKSACFKPTESNVVVEEISNQYDNVQTKMVPLRTFRPDNNLLDTLPDYLSKQKMVCYIFEKRNYF